MPKFLDQSALQYFWSKLKDSLLPGASSADNGKFLGIQNGEWALATPEAGESGGGGEITLLQTTSLTTWAQNATLGVVAGEYDMIGISCIADSNRSTTQFGAVQWFPVPGNGGDADYGLFCMNVNDDGSTTLGEAQVRMINISRNGANVTLKSITEGYYYNWGNKGPGDNYTVPKFIYGMRMAGGSGSGGGGTGGSGEGGISYTIGAGLRVSGNTLMVDTATAVESGNTKPITSDAVYDAIGNVETLLSQI